MQITTKQLVIIGPVQIVEGYLNYTKFKYFWLRQVVQKQEWDSAKMRYKPGFARKPGARPDRECANPS